MFEEHGYGLACCCTMSDYIHFIRSQEISLIKQEIAHRNVGIILRGQLLSVALAIAVCFIDDREIKFRLIYLQLLTKP